MDYYQAPPGDAQKQPLEPKSIISGSLPGATEIRIGNNIKISGKNQQVLVTTTGGSVTIGSTSDGRLAVEAINSDGSKVGIGDIPGTTNLGLYSVDSSSHTTSVLGKQSDGSNSLKFFDASNIGLAQFGNFASGGIALKIAQAGIEVGTATNDQLIFNSGQNIFKIVTTGTATVGGHNGSGTNTTTVTFTGLNRRPIVFAFLTGTPINIGGDSYEFNYLAGATSASISDWQSFFPYQSGTDGKVDFSWINFSAVDLSIYTASWKYYVLQEAGA